jgi:hypothetical protein
MLAPVETAALQYLHLTYDENKIRPVSTVKRHNSISQQCFASAAWKVDLNVQI